MADHYFLSYSSADALLAQTAADSTRALDTQGLAEAGLALCAAGGGDGGETPSFFEKLGV